MSPIPCVPQFAFSAHPLRISRCPDQLSNEHLTELEKQNEAAKAKEEVADVEAQEKLTTEGLTHAFKMIETGLAEIEKK